VKTARTRKHTFGNEQRFRDVKNATKRTLPIVGPNSYFNNPLYTIEASVNQSHHSCHMPTMGTPCTTTDNTIHAFHAYCNKFDDTFATLKYKTAHPHTNLGPAIRSHGVTEIDAGICPKASNLIEEEARFHLLQSSSKRPKSGG